MPKDANKMMSNVPQDLGNHGTWKKKLAIANKKYVDEKILIVKLHGILKL